MAWKEQGNKSDLGPVCYKNGDYNSGAYNLFDEMAASDWRSPSRVLEVSIHRAYYPITEKVLHLVFDPFGEVQHVQVIGRSDHVEAQVVFQSKHEAAEAYGDLHGQNIYDGCCQMEIKWGFSQDSDVSLVTSNGYTDASSSSKLFPSVSADDINWGSSQEVSCWSSQEVSCCDNMARSSSSMFQASTTSTIVEEQGPDSSLVVVDVLATDVVPIPDVTGIEPPTTYSMMGLNIATCVNQEVAAFPLVEALSEDLNSNKLYVDANAIGGHGQGLAIATTHDCISVATPSITVPYVMDSDVIDELQVPVVLMDASDASGRSFRDDSVIVLWALPMRCAEWQSWPPPMPLRISCDSIGMWPMSWPSLSIAHAIADEECYRLPRKPPWPPQAQRDFRFLPADMLQSLEFMRLTPVRVAELNPWPPPVLKEIGEFLCAKSAWSLLILIQEARQRECITVDQHIFSILTVEMVQLLECMIPSTVLLVSTRDKVVLDSRWYMHTMSAVVAVRRSYGVLRASVSLLDMKPIPTYVTATKCFATTECIITRVSSSSRSSAYQISVCPDAKQCYVDILMIHGQPYILQRQYADPLQSKRYGAAQLFHCIAAPYDQARHQGEKKVNNASMSCTQLAWDPGGGMTRDGAACCVVINYQQRPLSSLGFHYYIITSTVSMFEPMLYDTDTITTVFKFSPQQLATGKDRLQVEILAALTEHNCLLICTGLLIGGAGGFVQTPWDHGDSKLLFDGNDGPRFLYSCLWLAGQLWISSYCTWSTTPFKVPLYQLEGKSDPKKGRMLGNLYVTSNT